MSLPTNQTTRTKAPQTVGTQTARQIAHYAPTPALLHAPGVFKCTRVDPWDPYVDSVYKATMVFHEGATLQSGTTYKCPNCGNTFSST